jgi:hypothetical protein
VPGAYCQHHTVSGKIISSKDKNPIEFATVSLPDNELWAITDEKGDFTLKNVPVGKTILTAYCLGYVKTTFEIDVKDNISNLTLSLPENNLALNEVVVTAQQGTSNLTSSYIIDRTTLDHAQVLNVTDITSLLPGGKSTGDTHLAVSDDNRFALRSGSSEFGNASFGTAVEIDGVRLQNNSEFNVTNGVSTRNVSTINIESIEVITGIPSVEYGDLSNGIVKINTRKGRSPYIVEMATKPNTKQIALSKGFSLGTKGGTLNTSLEHTKSISKLESPYTSYDRNILSLNYSTVFNQSNNQPITLNIGFTGNIGGYNSEEDPDSFVDTYEKMRDNTYRGNFKLNWLLNKSWITNLEFLGSVNYSDKLLKENVNRNSSSSQAAIHTTEEGYFIATPYEENPNAPIILLPSGYWYELSYTDNKPINYSAKLKADWVRKFGSVTNKLMIGAEFDRTGNRGRKLYYDDMKYAPTWREKEYTPYMNNIALYAENKLTLPVNNTSTLLLTTGVRSDITYIKNSEYGTVQSFSPRLSAKYIFWEKPNKTIRELSMYAGWGKAVKLPSFEILYPLSTYSDKLAFAPGTPEDGNTFYAYYVKPSKAIYNSDLKWQYSNQAELGINANIKGAKISISGYLNRTYNPYLATNVYTPYSYKLTDQRTLEGVVIPEKDRVYSIDQITGIVTVSDKTGTHASQQLEYMTRNTYHSNIKYTNGSKVERSGIDWAVDFAQIQSLRTSIRLDGNYYHYRGVDETLIAWKPSESQSTVDREPYKYIGYYAGYSNTSTERGVTASVSNGKLKREFNANLTITTHIPKIRLILSMKIEASFYNYTRNLSEYDGSERGFVINSTADFFGDDTNIYGKDRYVAVYPLYYSTWDDPSTKIPFAEKFKWAKDNDTDLYNELSKLVTKTNTDYYFNPNRISAYYAANISVTKEIGDFASLSFYANNFINSMSRVTHSDSNTEISLYKQNFYIPKFYYGLSLRIKL